MVYQLWWLEMIPCIACSKLCQLDKKIDHLQKEILYLQIMNDINQKIITLNDLGRKVRRTFGKE